MEISGALNQYMNICRDDFDGSAAKLNISFKSAIIETLLLFMVIPRKINFTQLERYGNRCEQCYRQTFTKEFDWIRYNMKLMNTLFDRNDRKAIGLDSMGFHLVSRLRDDASLMYIHDGQPTGKRGRPKIHGDKIDFNHLDYTKIQEIETSNEDGKLYTLIAYSQAMKRKIRLVIWINKKGKHKLYFSTDINMSARDVIDFYRTRFQIEFCYRDAKQFTGLHHSQARDIRRLDFAFNASFTAINVAKIMMKENSIPFSMETLKSLMFKSYLLDRFFKLSGVKPNRRINAKLVKELIDIAAYQAA